MSARLTSINVSNNSDMFLFGERGFLEFTPDKKDLFAISQDGMIYKFNYNSESGLSNMLECCSFKLNLNEMIGFISVSNSGDVAIASNNHELVKLYSMNLENGKLNDPELVTKCPGATTALAINPSGSILCCSGSDNNVKVINIKDKNFPLLNQFPATHFVKAISFNPTGTLLALLQVDGTLRIFKIVENNPAPQLFKTLIGPKCDFDGNLQISWKEDFMSVLYGGKMVRIYEINNWTIKSEFNSDLIFSFELISRDVGLITQFPSEIALYSVVKNEIIESIDYKGFDDCSACLIGYDEKFACVFSESLLYSIDLQINPMDLKSKHENLNLLKKKLKEKSFKKSKFIDNSALSFSSDDEEEEEQEEIDDLSGDEEMDRESDVESQDSRQVNESENENENESEIDNENEELVDNYKYNSKEKVIFHDPHPIIQPCCTPWRNLQRYLAYNNVGFITARRQLENDSIYNYDIEFMDRHSHKPIRFSDEISYSLGAIDEIGAVLAADGVGACIHYISFENSLDSWTIPLSLGTEPILVGINSSSIYVINNRGILNIYSLTGLLRSSVTCPGRPISLIVCTEKVFMFTEDSEGILCYRLDPFNGGVIKSTQGSRVLLGSKDNLKWCGVSYTGVLGVFSTNGRLSLLLTRTTDRWTEILDTSLTLEEKSEILWPVYFDTNSLSGMVCKIIDGFPDPYPAPHVIDFNFRIPELPTDSFSNSYEELLRTNLLINETESLNFNGGLTEKEKKKLFSIADRHLLELAQISIKSERYSRLIDLAQLASNEKTIDLMIQLSKHYKLISLIDELETLKMKIFRSKVEIEVVKQIIPQMEIVEDFPRLPGKESLSASGILANLTPIKTNNALIDVPVSSPVELAPSPLISTSNSNPFAKHSNENNNNSTENQENVIGNNVMLDYISTMMKMNNNGSQKRKPEESIINNTKK